MNEQNKIDDSCEGANGAVIHNWDQVRIAYHVARLGTLSAAAAYLQVHHATVIRHIDALEAELGTKLFQRHPRGYTPTEAGQDLLSVAATTEDMFAQFAGRAIGRGNSVSGELIVTTVSSLVPHLNRIYADFRALHPDIRFRQIVEERRAKLEHGEAHIALRAGQKPQEPDNIAQPLANLGFGLYAHPSYIARKGLPETENDFPDHEFVGSLRTGLARSPFNQWLSKKVPEDRFVFRSNDLQSIIDAVVTGIGIGFMTKSDSVLWPDLVEVVPPKTDWVGTLWLVTHVDMHRTMKVQEFSRFLRQRAKDWPV
jgi:DNA-binding transcriptional LysR family regulator